MFFVVGFYLFVCFFLLLYKTVHCHMVGFFLLLHCFVIYLAVYVHVFSARGSCLHSQTARRCFGCAHWQGQRVKSKYSFRLMQMSLLQLLKLKKKTSCCSVLCRCVQSLRITQQTMDLCVPLWQGGTSALMPPWPSSWATLGCREAGYKVQQDVNLHLYCIPTGRRTL